VKAAPACAVPATGAFSASGDRWRFEGALTLDNAAGVLQVSRALAWPAAGRIDMSGIARADSAALAVVIAIRRRAAAEGRLVAIEGLPQSLQSLAVVYGVESLLA
jgi:phospholipid transport system transporter-binding protein